MTGTVLDVLEQHAPTVSRIVHEHHAAMISDLVALVVIDTEAPVRIEEVRRALYVFCDRSEE